MIQHLNIIFILFSFYQFTQLPIQHLTPVSESSRNKFANLTFLFEEYPFLTLMEELIISGQFMNAERI